MSEDVTNSYSVDLDSDCLPELVLYREASRTMEVWKGREDKGFVRVARQSLPSVFSRNSTKVIGQPTFADMGRHTHTYTVELLYYVDTLVFNLDTMRGSQLHRE